MMDFNLMFPRNLVLVTGMPRSGTTVIGERLMASRRVAEIYEPLNPQVGIPLGREVFPLVNAKDHTSGLSQSDVLMLAERVSRLNLRTGQCVPGSKRSTLFNRTRRTILTAKIKPWQNTLIWKDPFAAFLAKDICQLGVCPVVFTLRGPLETAASFCRMDWSIDSQRLSERVKLAGYIHGDLPFVPAYVRPNVASATLLWLILHRNIVEWMKRDIPILWCPILDNAIDPEGVGKRLQEFCALPTTLLKPVQEVGHNKEGLTDHAHIKDRSLETIRDYWRRILTPQEADWISENCGNLWDDISARATS